MIYARCEIIILDDSFSALDGKTENHIVENLLGSGGQFKKMGTTVFLVTNASKSSMACSKNFETANSPQRHISI